MDAKVNLLGNKTISGTFGSQEMPIEIFIQKNLKLDISNGVGKQVYERLSQLPQNELNKLSAKSFSNMQNASFDNVADALGIVNIRTQDEIRMRDNSPRFKKEQEARVLRKCASENFSIAYDNAINTIKQYQDNQGLLNVGFYREKLGQLLSKVNPTDVNTCFDDVVKKLEQEKEFAVSYLKTNSAN